MVARTAKKSIGLISRKKNFERAAHFFLHLLAFVCTTTTYNFQKRRSYICVPVCIFFTAAHFILVAASISHLLTAAIKFSCFFSGRKEIRLLFKFFLYLWLLFFFCYPHQCRHRNLLEQKNWLCWCFFLSKNLGGHEISPLLTWRDKRTYVYQDQNQIF